MASPNKVTFPVILSIIWTSPMLTNLYTLHMHCWRRLCKVQKLLSPQISSRTDRHTHTYSSQYFTTAAAGEVNCGSGCQVLWWVRLCVCLFVCVSVCLRGYLRNHRRDLFQFLWMLPIAVARSSSGVLAIRYVLPVLWMTSCFLYNGPYNCMNFATSDRFRLNLLIFRKVGQNSISWY